MGFFLWAPWGFVSRHLSSRSHALQSQKTSRISSDFEFQMRLRWCMPCTVPVLCYCELTAMISSVSANYSKKKMTNEEKKVVMVMLFLSFCIWNCRERLPFLFWGRCSWSGILCWLGPQMEEEEEEESKEFTFYFSLLRLIWRLGPIFIFFGGIIKWWARKVVNCRFW